MLGSLSSHFGASPRESLCAATVNDCFAIVDAAERHAFCKAEPWIVLSIHAHRENDVAQTLMDLHTYFAHRIFFFDREEVQQEHGRYACETVAGLST